LKRVVVLGLDSAPPELVFDSLNELPNIRRLVEEGISARLESCHPPITVPAWMVMVTGKNPGRLGLYGFRHRRGYSYADTWIASSQSIWSKTVWDILSDLGRRVCVVGVPPSYPPKPVNGHLVSCLLTPSAEKEYTYPPDLKMEIEGLVGSYVFDVVFRTDDRAALLEQLYEMTEKRFRVARHLIQTKPWDFFMLVEIGVDRLHHAFWKFFDRTHAKYAPGNKYEHVVKDYYRFLDERIGEVLGLLDEGTCLLLVSDHGTKGMRGAFCVNEWLIQQGYLALEERPDGVVDLEEAKVDWARTRCWGWGGYHARVFLNVKGREPLGVIEPGDYEAMREELSRKLREVRDPNGRVMNTKVFKPEKLYGECRGDYPDLMVYFDDLYWRAAGTIGHNTLYLSENDTGPDDSVHSTHGVFILHNPSRKHGLRRGDVNILDVAPTLLRIMGVETPRDMEGKAIDEVMAWGE